MKTHQVKKIPLPKGWAKIAEQIHVGRPTDDHITVNEFCSATGMDPNAARALLTKMVKEGKASCIVSTMNGKRQNFYLCK